jgi:radical SAM protein with 4Fe4S-binding SPASM domain
LDKDVYPALKKGGYIHLLPNGGLVQIDTGSINPVWKWMLDEVNEEFIRVIRLCDGTRTLSDLFDKISSDQNYNISKEQVQSIIELAEWRRVIDIMNAPEKRSITVQGSTKWYVPLHMFLEITDHCNFYCRHCYRESSPALKRYLRLEIIDSFLKTLVKIGLRSVEITGGEPLTHPQAADIINLATSRCDIVALLTNGYYIDCTFLDKIHHAIDSKKLMASVTINSSTPSFHDSFTKVSGAWKRATKAVKLLVKAGVMTRFTMNITPGNLNDLEPTIILAKDLGADAFVASPVMPFGRGSQIDWNKITRKKMSEFEKEFSIMMRKYPNFFLTIPDDIRRNMRTQNCGAGFRSFVMSPIADVRPCVNVSEKLLNFGNVVSKDIIGIFSHPAIKSIRTLKAPSPATCLGCKLENFCMLCWYRGLVGSQYVKKCAWLETTDLSNYVDMNMVKEITYSCNLKSYHSFRDIH